MPSPGGSRPLLGWGVAADASSSIPAPQICCSCHSQRGHHMQPHINEPATSDTAICTPALFTPLFFEERSCGFLGAHPSNPCAVRQPGNGSIARHRGVPSSAKSRPTTDQGRGVGPWPASQWESIVQRLDTTQLATPSPAEGPASHCLGAAVSSSAHSDSAGAGAFSLRLRYVRTLRPMPAHVRGQRRTDGNTEQSTRALPTPPRMADVTNPAFRRTVCAARPSCEPQAWVGVHECPCPVERTGVQISLTRLLVPAGAILYGRWVWVGSGHATRSAKSVRGSCHCSVPNVFRAGLPSCPPPTRRGHSNAQCCCSPPRPFPFVDADGGQDHGFEVEHAH